MPPHRKLVTRPPVRREQILTDLRGRILSGDLLPGARLPNRRELEERFQVSPMTVQRAMDRLIAQGFVRARAGHGTFVVDTPPHLHRFGLVIPFIHNSMDSQFFDAMARESQRSSHPGVHSISVYTEHGYGSEASDYDILQADVCEHGLAGLIFATTPFVFKNTPVLTDPRVTRVGIMPYHPEYGFPAVHTERHAFFQRGMEFLAQRGCRRLAVLDTTSALNVSPPATVSSLARQFGLVMHPYWYQSGALTATETARQIMHLMFGSGAAERPDALLIADDNLVAQATLGLRAAGLGDDAKLEIVAHCNYPWPPPTNYPVTWLGYDTRAILDKCVGLLDGQRRGETVPQDQEVPPMFAAELGSRAFANTETR